MATDCPSASSYIGDCELTEALLKRAAARNEGQQRTYAWKNCLPKAEPVKLLLLDVDGVLTDGSITYNDEGSEIKTFNARDGFGLNLLSRAGVEIGLITARSSRALERRVQDLKITHIYQGVREKVTVFDRIRQDLNLEPGQIAYIGDDWLDLALLSQVGFSATVSNGAPEVRKIVDYVATLAGGQGAVREICELIVDAKGCYEGLLARYLTKGLK